MIHPAARITVYVFLAVLVPLLPAILIPWLTLVVLALHWPRRRSLLQLLRRTRWLFLMLFVSYAWVLPGEPLWLALGAWTPTVEGVAAGLLQATRLLLLLSLLDLWVLALDTPALLTGLLSLIYPLRRLGVDAERIAVRLALTLRAMENPPGLREAMAILSQSRPPLSPPETIKLARRALNRRDWAVIAAVATLLGGVWINR
ncbi:MAG: hypothetical protein FJ210_04655 [Betaproteobacteria bacterium]|nr:hypothetical protein [Betaproteobacteria bacterium]